MISPARAFESQPTENFVGQLKTCLEFRVDAARTG